jgi:hypothetical protein
MERILEDLYVSGIQVGALDDDDGTFAILNCFDVEFHLVLLSDESMMNCLGSIRHTDR